MQNISNLGYDSFVDGGIVQQMQNFNDLCSKFVADGGIVNAQMWKFNNLCFEFAVDGEIYRAVDAECLTS